MTMHAAEKDAPCPECGCGTFWTTSTDADAVCVRCGAASSVLPPAEKGQADA